MIHHAVFTSCSVHHAVFTMQYSPTAVFTMQYSPTAVFTMQYSPTAVFTMQYSPTAVFTMQYSPTADHSADTLYFISHSLLTLPTLCYTPLFYSVLSMTRQSIIFSTPLANNTKLYQDYMRFVMSYRYCGGHDHRRGVRQVKIDHVQVFMNPILAVYRRFFISFRLYFF